MKKYRLCVDDRLYEFSSLDDLIEDLDPEHINSLFRVWIRYVLSDFGVQGLVDRVFLHTISGYNLAPDFMEAYESMRWAAVYDFMADSFNLSDRKGHDTVWIEDGYMFSFRLMEGEE